MHQDKPTKKEAKKQANGLTAQQNSQLDDIALQIEKIAGSPENFVRLISIAIYLTATKSKYELEKENALWFFSTMLEDLAFEWVKSGVFTLEVKSKGINYGDFFDAHEAKGCLIDIGVYLEAAGHDLANERYLEEGFMEISDTINILLLLQKALYIIERKEGLTAA